MHDLAAIIQDLLILIGVVFLASLGLVIYVARLPSEHPLKQILISLCLRLGATLGAGLVAVPVQPVPGLDAVYDIGAPVALAWFWYIFVRNALRKP